MSGAVALLADVLRRLYSDEYSLRRILAMAKVDAGRVVFDGRAANMAWSAASEAVLQGRALTLMAVVAEEYGADPWVVGLLAWLHKGGEV